MSVTKGTAPSLSVSYNASTNRRSTDTADANGNILQNGITAYDIENRIASANITNGEVRYSYAPGNKRVWRGTWVSGSQTVDELTYYSAGGAKLCAYNLTNSGTNLRAVSTGYYEYFGGKLIKNAQGYISFDRLGPHGKYFPYGQDRGSNPSNGSEKFATYTRDAETGLDYAQNRCHSSGDGRYLSPDPYQPSAGPSDPGSWNRYAYVGGDPINYGDPSGLYKAFADAGEVFWYCWDHDIECYQEGISIDGGANVYHTWDALVNGTTGGGGGQSQTTSPTPKSYKIANASWETERQLLERGRDLALTGLIDGLSEGCSNLLNGLLGVIGGGLTISNLADQLASTRINDGTGNRDFTVCETLDSGSEADSLRFYCQQHPEFTIGQLFKDKPTLGAWASAGGSVAGNRVFFNPAFESPREWSTGAAASLLIHEVLHTMGGLDAGLLGAIGAKTDGPSDPITAAIQQKCF